MDISPARKNILFCQWLIPHKTRFVLGLVLTTITNVSLAGPYTYQMELACSDKWTLLDNTIEINPDTNPWGPDAPPGSQQSTNIPDKNGVQTHLNNTSLITTIAPAEVSDMMNDPLTIASECMVYRNLEVDHLEYVAPTSNILPNVPWLPGVLHGS